MKNFINFLPPWVETNIQTAFYDKESGTCLQQTARMYAKVNQLVRHFNCLAKETKETVDEYIAKFVELKDFVDTYFENLDVQEEINNKLDQMAEDGTLQEIIASYLNANAVWGFDNVAGMKISSNLIDGSYARTLGYYAKNDGGAALYKIRNITNSDVVDEGSLIALDDASLVAELIVENGSVKLKQFGAKADGITDDTNTIQKAINAYDVIEGDLSDIYYVNTGEIDVEDKELKNIKIKAEPFQVVTGNTFKHIFNFTGNNIVKNVYVESEFEYIPSTAIYVDPEETNGLASNVKAFYINGGTTSFYECETSYCYPFSIYNTANVNIYSTICRNSEMNFTIESTGKIRVYDSQFEINKAVDSEYYHHIYARGTCNIQFNNCSFTEIGAGTIGNHYHAYATSYQHGDVLGNLVLNNCTLKTEKAMGQINCCNLTLNGGSVESSIMLTGGNDVADPVAMFNGVDFKFVTTNNSSFDLSKTRVIVKNCSINIPNATGTAQLSSLQYKIYNTAIDMPNGTYSCNVLGSSGSHNTYEQIIDNCSIHCNSVAWCYPTYCDDAKITNTTFSLYTEKSNSNPTDRGTTGYLYNCIFNNWATPLNANSSNTLKYSYISAGVAKTNTTTS